MKPDTLKRVGSDIHLCKLRCNLLGNCGTDLSEDFASFLNEKLIDLPDTFFGGAIEETEIISNIIGENRL
mgnify:CR=1 FL=1